MMLAGALEWVLTIQTIVEIRQMMGMPYERMVMILGGVALFTALSGLLLETRGRKNRLPDRRSRRPPGWRPSSSWRLLLVPVQLFVDLDRASWPSASCPPRGWWEAFVLAFYAGWLADKLREPAQIKSCGPGCGWCSR